MCGVFFACATMVAFGIACALYGDGVALFLQETFREVQLQWRNGEKEEESGISLAAASAWGEVLLQYERKRRSHDATAHCCIIAPPSYAIPEPIIIIISRRSGESIVPLPAWPFRFFPTLSFFSFFSPSPSSLPLPFLRSYPTLYPNHGRNGIPLAVAPAWGVRVV